MDAELKTIIEALGNTFEEFKKSNNERIAQIESKGKADPLLEGKVDKLAAEVQKLDSIKTNLEELEIKLGRIALYADSGKKEKSEYNKSFESFMRTGEGKEKLRLIKTDAFGSATNGGGYAIPEDLDTQIQSLLGNDTPMRQVANVIRRGSGYKKNMNKHGALGGRVGETDARAATEAPELGQVTPFFCEYYAWPEETVWEFQDANFNVEAWFVEETSKIFREYQNYDFTRGSGITSAKGFGAYAKNTDADGIRTFGYLQEINTGVTGGFKQLDPIAGASPVDTFIETIYKLRAGHRANARWMANRLTLAEVMKFKDNDGNLMWSQSMIAGQPSSLLGYPITENDDMPDIADDASPIAFGDFKAGYTIVDIPNGMLSMRDDITHKGYIGIYTTMRTGGMVTDSEAIKMITLSLS